MMKKMTKLLLAALMAGTLLTASAYAVSITDNADILTDEEETSLLAQMEQIAGTYAFDINIYTTDSYVYYDEDAQFDADAIFETCGMGYGENLDGVLYYLRMSDRKYAVCTTGCGEYVFDDYALDELDNAMLPRLGGNEWYAAFCSYVSVTDQMLARAEYDAAQYGYDFHDLSDVESNIAHYGSDTDNTERTPKKKSFPVGGAVLSAIITFFTSLGKTSSKKRQMNTAVASTNANRSMAPEGLKLTYNNDILMFSNVTRVRRQTENRSSGGSFAGHSGGGHHTSMSGGSHGGRSGGF